MQLTRVLKVLSKSAAWARGLTSAILCFSAGGGYWLPGERRRAICCGVLGAVEGAAIVLCRHRVCDMFRSKASSGPALIRKFFKTDKSRGRMRSFA